MSGPRVVVVGGGISGLACAFTLQGEAERLGMPLDLALVDAGRGPGGHAQTVVDDGWLVETGPNGFLDREPETLALVHEAGVDARLVDADAASARRFIVKGGRLHRVPDSPRTLAASGALSWLGKLRLAGEPLAPGPPRGVDETVFDFARRRIGREAAETLVDTAVSGISAGDSRKLSVASQFPVMVEMEREHGSLVRAMFARRRRGVGPGRLKTLDRGMGLLTRAIADRLRGATRPMSAVVSAAHAGSEWRVRLSDGTTVAADHLVLAVPGHRAATIVSGFDGGLARLLEAIDYSSVSVVALGYRRQDFRAPLDGYGYLVTRSEGLATLGVVWESSIFGGPPPDGMVLLRVILGGARRPDVADRDEAGTLALARAELARVMGVSVAPARSWVFRWPSAIAQYTVGHAGRVAAIRERAAAHPGLTMCGTAYDGASFNHAVAGARRAARAIAASLLSTPCAVTTPSS